MGNSFTDFMCKDFDKFGDRVSCAVSLSNQHINFNVCDIACNSRRNHNGETHVCGAPYKR